jgi:hypothetical protein
MNTQTITIQEFSRMMASDEKSVLPGFIREIVKLARPEDVRLSKFDEDPNPDQSKRPTPGWR